MKSSNARGREAACVLLQHPKVSQLGRDVIRRRSEVMGFEAERAFKCAASRAQYGPKCYLGLYLELDWVRSVANGLSIIMHR